MYGVEGSIVGLKPLLFNKAIGNVQDPKGKRPTPEQIKERVPLQCHYGDRDVGIVIPEDMFFAVILTGCSMAGLKNGKSGLWKYLKGALSVDGPLVLGKATYDRVLETNVIKKQGAIMQMIYKCYPLIEAGWSAKFKLIVADDSIESESIKIAIEHGGLFVGIGAWRPKYGRFALGTFQKVKM